VVKSCKSGCGEAATLLLSWAPVGEFTFRVASVADAQLMADMRTAYFPDEPKDPDVERHNWDARDPDDVHEDYVVARSGEECGMAGLEHSAWAKMPERFCHAGALLRRDLASGDRWNEVYDFIEARAVAGGARIAVGSAREDDGGKAEALAARGYIQKRLSKAWELDLVANRDRILAMQAESRARARANGVHLLTVADDSDPDRYNKLYECSNEGELDEPTTVPHVLSGFDVFMKWLRAPNIREDRWWIARKGEAIVGMSVLAYPPGRGNVWTDWTCTARAVRGEGLARALKLETLVQAIGLEVPRVRTSNDGENAPILHLNEQMGYRRIPGWLEFHKALS